ncbi:hypothetical protein [Psychrobacter sp.]|uniref:hypothetical protein n=1 Tax=Psychrobacter sp. TaxID=56811 RepID=UPI003C75C2E5
MADLRSVFNKDVTMSFQVDTPLQQAKFYESGAFVTDPRLNVLLNSGTQAFDIPNIKALDTNLESNYGNTVFTDIAMPRKIDGYKSKGRAAYINEGFLESSLESYLIGTSPNQAIAGMLDNYWANQLDNRAIATLFGLRALDSTDKDLTLDISLGTATAASKFSVDAFIDVEATMADMYQGNGVMVVHPQIAASMRKQQLVEYVTTSANLTPVEMYNGRRIVTSNKGTKIGTTANAKFVSYLMSAGAFATAMSRGRDDLEIERTASTGNGAGHNALWTRANTLIHPQGFSFIADESTLTGGTSNEAISASWADLQKGENWRMDADVDNIGIRFLITNV